MDDDLRKREILDEWKGLLKLSYNHEINICHSNPYHSVRTTRHDDDSIINIYDVIKI
jgi:hypothetical protein